jgi:Tfp pilus assembly protein PilX
MTDVHLKRVEDDGFKAENPDSLMDSVARTNLRRPMGISLLLHVSVILLLSLSTVSLCIKYKTANPRTAIEQRDKVALDKAASIKAAEKEERKQKLAAEAEAKVKADAKMAKPANPKANDPAGLDEISGEPPESSSLDGIDDFLD